MMRAMLLAAVLFMALSGAGAAQTLARQWERCRADDGERQIGGCSAVIRAARDTAEDLARAYYHRGRAYADVGRFDRALHDFDQATRLDPGYADAFNNRGVTFSGMGQFERAIQDFDEAIRLDPNYAIAIYNRGLALQNAGQAEEAARSFARAKEVGPRLTPPRE